MQLNIHISEITVTAEMASGDRSTALPEQASPVRLEWSGTLLDGKTSTYTEAEKAIAALGPGWRFPSRQELELIVDLSRHEPAIDTAKFPDTKSESYWTDTPCAWRDDAVWVVDFNYGDVLSNPRDNGACVRAVRSGQ